MKSFSKIISVIFHPLFVPTLGLFLLFSIGDNVHYVPFQVKRIVYIAVFVSSCLLPLSITPLLFILKKIKSMKMETRRERLLPMFITGMFFITGYYFLSLISVIPVLILNYIIATIITIFIALGITYFWKISIHMTGMGGLSGGLLAFAYLYVLDIHIIFSALVIISGLLGTARLYLQAHTPAQVYAGYTLGFFTVFSYVSIMA
jgi:hypothetical protein